MFYMHKGLCTNKRDWKQATDTKIHKQKIFLSDVEWTGHIISCIYIHDADIEKN